MRKQEKAEEKQRKKPLLTKLKIVEKKREFWRKEEKNWMSYFYGYPYDSGYAFYTQGPPPPPQGKSQNFCR